MAPKRIVRVETVEERRPMTLAQFVSHHQQTNYLSMDDSIPLWKRMIAAEPYHLDQNEDGEPTLLVMVRRRVLCHYEGED